MVFLLAALPLTACGGAPPTDPPLSALLVTLDTTRADALACYGNPAARTPRIDRLARESLLYERAYTVTPLTLPSHASMLTGLYPPRHGVRANGPAPLPRDVPTLAEAARERGHRTAAFVAASVLDASFGLANGFERYEFPGRASGPESHYAERTAEEVVDQALAWLAEERKDRPFLLWVHLFDPHAPYDPPDAFADASPDPYLAEVAYVDAEVGRLIDGLRDAGLLNHTLVVLVADHGEAFGEHGEPTHGTLCYEATLRVPLLVRYPDLLRRGERTRELVSVVDIAPTLASALGLELGADVDGVDLYRRPSPPDRGVYFESYNGFAASGSSQLAGWLNDQGKYLHSSEPELYDLASDPQETRNLFGRRSTERHRDAIADLAARPRYEADGAVSGELMADVQALGYAGAVEADTELPHPLADLDLPSPVEVVRQENEVRRAMALANQGHVARARALLEPIVNANPRNFLAADLLAHCLIQEERWSAALPLLERLTSAGPGWPRSFHSLGSTLEALDRADEAVDAYRRALVADPAWAPSREALTRLGAEGAGSSSPP